MDENTTITLKSIIAFEKEIIQKAKDILIELTKVDNAELELSSYEIDTDNETFVIGFSYNTFNGKVNKIITITKEGSLISFKSQQL